MNIPEEFGKYLLLKKLREDPLGETFRAGRMGKDGIEQVVLLRVLNGQGLDGEKLWNRVSGRGPVQQALRSPNIGSGVDLGRVRSYPYVAYDYVSGKDLATLFAQSARLHSPIPADHALLIAERIALALAAAYETRVQDERVLHGFVVPQLVMISNEGESRLLGFEVAPGLRELAAGGFGNPELRPYLAPEAATAPLGRADDVYSLGAILYELLTGQRLPPATADGYGALIDAAELPNEGTPLPPAIAALLKKSLVPREQRIPDAVTWHKTISKLMIDGHFTSTTFNLAFFMHNLFREEIERESQEIQAEKSLELPRRTAAAASAPAAPAAAAAPVQRESTGVREPTYSGTVPHPAQAAEGGSKTGLWIGIAAVALVALAGGGYYAFGRSPAKPAATTAAATLPAAPAPGAQPAPAPGANPAAAPAGPTPEQLKAQIDQMVAASGKEMEAKLKQQYDERIKQLQGQLEESRKATARNERPSAPPPAPVEPAPAPVETRPASRPEPPAAQPTQPAAGSTAPAASPTASTATSVPPPAASAPAPATPPPAPAPAPARQPQVQYGDLVQPGPGVALPRMTSQPDPRYPSVARRFNKAAQVSLKVLVDERGRVLEAERIGEKAGFGFDEAALEAAHRAVFQPASKDGVRVKMWTSMRITFKP